MANKKDLIDKREERKKIIQELQKERNSKVICYLTADRTNFGTQMSSDTIPLFYDHLCSIKRAKNIDIFLYTRGGYTLTPNRLVYIFREFCEKLSVLIPFRAHSAGTTLALGANEIVMGPMGELGPVDPSVSNVFNPTKDKKDRKDNKGDHIPISVEDVSAYMDLVRDKLSEEPLILSTALKALSDKIHPLALGNVHRQYLLIRTMSKRLLSLHMDIEKEEEKIDKIVDILSQKLYFHAYEIARYEAKKIIGLNVIFPSEKIEQLIWRLYIIYKEMLLLGEEINLDAMLNNKDSANFYVDSAIIESENHLHSFSFSGNIKRKRSGKREFDVDLNRLEWKKCI